MNRSTVVEESKYVTDISKSRDLTEEQRHALFLGRGDDIFGRKEAMFDREEFCGACGTVHGRISLLDIYPACKSCFCVLRQPSSLRKRLQYIKQEEPLEVLFASYGDFADPELAVDVTESVRDMVMSTEFRDRLAVKPTMNANEALAGGVDPAPGMPKQLRLRYRMHGIHATLVLEFKVDGHTPTPFLLLTPKQRHLKVFLGVYGHPKGATPSGRMSSDVTELLQSLIDQQGGSFLSVSSYTPLTRLFQDPCPGYPKDLRLQYEIRGRSGAVTFSEVRGHLRKRLHIQQSPIVAPLIYVLSATYGITPTSRRTQLDYIARQIGKIVYIEHK